jgi:hypothetical protein
MTSDIVLELLEDNDSVTNVHDVVESEAPASEFLSQGRRSLIFEIFTTDLELIDSFAVVLFRSIPSLQLWNFIAFGVLVVIFFVDNLQGTLP